MVMNVSSYSATVLQQRSQVVALAIKYGAAFGFKEDTMYDGLQLFDKVSPTRLSSCGKQQWLCGGGGAFGFKEETL